MYHWKPHNALLFSLSQLNQAIDHRHNWEKVYSTMFHDLHAYKMENVCLKIFKHFLMHYIVDFYWIGRTIDYYYFIHFDLTVFDLSLCSPFVTVTTLWPVVTNRIKIGEFGAILRTLPNGRFQKQPYTPLKMMVDDNAKLVRKPIFSTIFSFVEKEIHIYIAVWWRNKYLSCIPNIWVKLLRLNVIS